MGNCAEMAPIAESISCKMDGNQAIQGHTLETTTSYILREKFFSWGGDFDINDSFGRKCFKIKGEVFTLRDAMIIYDLENNVACVL